MPIYEFYCEQCEKDSEILVRSSKWKGTACPHCGSKKLTKKLSVFASSGSSTRQYSKPASCDGSGTCGGCGGACGHHH